MPTGWPRASSRGPYRARAADTFDVYLTPHFARAVLVDFNPFSPTTDALLFDWAELTSGRPGHVPRGHW
jgi:hypothetical protein